MDITLLFIIIITTYQKTLLYELTCPHHSQRHLRAKHFCLSNNTYRYACLYDRNKQIVTESCSGDPDYSTPGEKYVLSGSRTTVECFAGRFQPFPLWANVSGRCLIIKSSCNDHGQLLSTNDSTKSDTTCRCDFKKQYDYITTPRDPCACVPSVEDCSCYFNTQIQVDNRFYKCASTDIIKGSTSTEGSKSNNKTDREERNIQAVKRQRFPPFIFVLVCLAVIAIFLPLLFYLCAQNIILFVGEKKLQSSAKENYSSTSMLNPQTIITSETNEEIMFAKTAETCTSKTIITTLSSTVKEDIKPENVSTIPGNTQIIAVPLEREMTVLSSIVNSDSSTVLLNTPTIRTNKQNISKTDDKTITKDIPTNVEKQVSSNIVMKARPEGHPTFDDDLKQNQSLMTLLNNINVQQAVHDSKMETPLRYNDSDVHQINTQLVAAIDIGTTSSVYAYYNKSTTDQSEIKSSSVLLNKPWDAGKGGLWSVKTPTCILLKEDLTVIAIGCDAQNLYRNYIYEEESKDVDETEAELKGCHFIDKFKMELYNQDFFTKEQIMDIKGRPVPADRVFSNMISKLKEHLENENSEVPKEAINWVLTIPAIWTKKAEDFMRHCAKLAGIDENRLSIVVESEAASVYMYHLMVEGQLHNLVKEMPNKYLVIDIGGGTCDITAHSVENGKLKTLQKPSGSNNGGTKVDQLLLHRFVEIVGSYVHSELKTNASYFELLEELESLNITASVTSGAKIPCKVPLSVLNDLCEKHSHEPFSTVIERLSSGHSKGISLTKDRLRVDRKLINTLISTVALGIIEDVQFVIDSYTANEIMTFFVVGGFSNSPIIRDKLKEAFPQKYLVFPPFDADVAVVKGAALHGNNLRFSTV